MKRIALLSLGFGLSVSLHAADYRPDLGKNLGFPIYTNQPPGNMLDNDPERDDARERLKKALETFASRDGVLGCYYVDQEIIAKCREFLAKSGLRKLTVEDDIVGNTQLPVIN